MKIIFITREGINLPGARIRCYNFAREISRYGIGTEILSFSDTLGAKDGEEESLMNWKDKVRFNWKAFKRLLNSKDAILYIQRFNYHAFAPYMAHLFNGNKIILDLDDWEIRENPKYYLRLYPSSKAHYCTRLIAKKSILCVAASRFLEAFLKQFNKKTYYMPSGVDTELFDPSLNNVNKNRIIFSWIGTFHRKEYIENIKFALSCFRLLRKKYPHIYFDIVGDGIYRNSLLKIINETPDPNVRWKGWISPRLIPSYLGTIHIGLFPSVSDIKFNRAKSPTKLFEYMAMAKPTISGAIGEARHIVKEGENGFLAKTKEEFVDNMQVLLENQDLHKHMGDKARRLVEENYSLRVLGRQLYGILKEI